MIARTEVLTMVLIKIEVFVNVKPSHSLIVTDVSKKRNAFILESEYT